MVVAAVHTEPMAIPASTTTPGLNDLIRHSPRMSRIENAENIKAITDVEYGFIPDDPYLCRCSFSKECLKAIFHRHI